MGSVSVGVDFGSQFVKFARVRRRGQNFEVERLVKIPRATSEVAQTVASGLKQAGLRASGAVLGVSGRGAIIRYTMVPPVPAYRLKMIMDAILRKEPVFFLIDEMLKGTNESDRHKGAIALVRQLVENNADGVLATHDLELTKLEKDYTGTISNYHFDGYIQGDRLLFDYKLKAGICQSSNALVLMKKVGIKID